MPEPVEPPEPVQAPKQLQSPEPVQPSVIVGVMPGQPDIVVTQAALFASRFGAELICAFVDASHYVVSVGIDGTIMSQPIDPDSPEFRDSVFDPELEDHLGVLLADAGIPWSTRLLAGEPGRALAALAGHMEALMIVVGTREATFRGGVREFFNGSVAVHLTHRQHRPVVVIPLGPTESADSLPWAGE